MTLKELMDSIYPEFKYQLLNFLSNGGTVEEAVKLFDGKLKKAEVKEVEVKEEKKTKKQ